MADVGEAGRGPESTRLKHGGGAAEGPDLGCSDRQAGGGWPSGQRSPEVPESPETGGAL